MIALTGATGFLGSRLVQRLTEKNIPVRCLVRRGSKNLKNLARLSLQAEVAPSLRGGEADEAISGFSIVEVDFSSVPSISKALEGCEIVIHSLGLINGSDSELNKVNVQFTQNLVLAAVERHVQKFIFISSVAAVMKHGAYGVSKFKAEEAVRHSGIPYLIFQPAWIFGPGDPNTTARILHALKYFPVVPLLGGGTFKLQPVYVDDAASVILQGLYFSKMNAAYVVAGKEQIALKDIFKIFSGHLKVKKFFLPVPLKPVQALMRIFLAIHPRTKLPAKQILELDKHEAFDISETCKDFQFSPMTFEQGAERMFR